MGIKDPTVILPAARVAASLTFVERAEGLGLPPAACRRPSDFHHRAVELQGTLGEQFGPLEQWTAGTVPKASVTEDHLSQKWWTQKIHQARAKKVGTRAATPGQDTIQPASDDGDHQLDDRNAE